jgi:hypothetical protein
LGGEYLGDNCKILGHDDPRCDGIPRRYGRGCGYLRYRFRFPEIVGITPIESSFDGLLLKPIIDIKRRNAADFRYAAVTPFGHFNIIVQNGIAEHGAFPVILTYIHICSPIEVMEDGGVFVVAVCCVKLGTFFKLLCNPLYTFAIGYEIGGDYL